VAVTGTDKLSPWYVPKHEHYLQEKMRMRMLDRDFAVYIRGLFKKYSDWNYSGCSVGGMCLQPA
jgi:hypothetical protein